jgi:hypothetical protein
MRKTSMPDWPATLVGRSVVDGFQGFYNLLFGRRSIKGDDGGFVILVGLDAFYARELADFVADRVDAMVAADIGDGVSDRFHQKPPKSKYFMVGFLNSSEDVQIIPLLSEW